MAPPKPPFDGSCLCGSVKIHITVSPLLTLACHCRDCQKLSASAFTLTTMFPKDGFSCTGDLVTGGLGSAGRVHHYCASCLTFVYSEITGAEQRVNLRSSILDNAAAFPPFVEVMTEEKLPWAETPAPRSYPRYPASRADLQALMDDYGMWEQI